MSDFDYQPLNGATPSYQPRVNATKFGDGYEQRAADGVNAMQESWSLTFRNTADIINTIHEFFESKGALESFTWTPSGKSEIRVVCRAWSAPVISKKNGEISCTFERVYGE